MTAAEKISELCKQRHWGLPNLAEASGIRYTTLRNYVGENPRKPPVDNAVKLSRALGVSVSWLFDDERGWHDRGRTPEDAESKSERLRHAIDYLCTALFWELSESKNEHGEEVANEYIAKATRIACGIGRLPKHGRLGWSDGRLAVVAGDHEITDGERHLYVPIVGSVAAGLPLRGTDGDYPAGIAGEYVLFDSADPNCFACRVVGDSMEPEYPEGTIIVSEPNRYRDEGDVCVVVLKNGTEQVVKVVKNRKLYSTNPKYNPVEIRHGDKPRLFPVVAKFPPDIQM